MDGKVHNFVQIGQTIFHNISLICACWVSFGIPVNTTHPSITQKDSQT